MSELGETDVRKLGLEEAGFFPCYLLGYHPVTNQLVRKAGDADRSMARKGPWVGPDGKSQLTRETISVRLRVPMSVGDRQYDPGDWVLWPLDRVEWLN